ncbi:MAG TPA: DUF4399 domain-containing protein [Myxococcota bacterium]|nr:DUF4399 domain-containing protein [Myxococcota bacterium]
MTARFRSIGLAGIALVAALAALAAFAQVPRAKAPAEAKLYFITPEDGQALTGEFTVRFGLTGMGVAPAGVATEGTGHHHLIVDAPLPPMNLPIPKDATHLHFGNGQTETTLELAPGEHTLQLLLADANHIPHEPPVVSERIRITVK